MSEFRQVDELLESYSQQQLNHQEEHTSAFRRSAERYLHYIHFIEKVLRPHLMQLVEADESVKAKIRPDCSDTSKARTYIAEHSHLLGEGQVKDEYEDIIAEFAPELLDAREQSER